MDSPARALWLAVMTITSFIVGGLVTWLTWASGENVYTALKSGGTGVGGTLVLLIAIYYFANHKPGTSG